MRLAMHLLRSLWGSILSHMSVIRDISDEVEMGFGTTYNEMRTCFF